MNTATFEDVANGVSEALRRQFGGSAAVEFVQEPSGDSAVLGFTVDGVDYSLMVNVTP